MGQNHHAERHFGGSAIVRDAVLGMSDGLTVPFALAAGLSGAVASSHLVVTAGLAEIVAGSISMGLGGYLAGRGEIEHYASERRREAREVVEIPEEEENEVAAVFAGYGLTRKEVAPVLAALRARPDAWVDFMMRFELGLEEPNPRRALMAALTVGLAYAIGGLVPLAPYVLTATASAALGWSIVVTSIALVVLGYTAMSG
jgi:VIT1/CCC1 family predicted Fe2+/Mn2+ transporter